MFDPVRPSLGSELEALRQHLEALSTGPSTWENHEVRPAGVPCVGIAWGRVSTTVTGSLPALSLQVIACLWSWTLVLHHNVPHLCALSRPRVVLVALFRDYLRHLSPS